MNNFHKLEPYVGTNVVLREVTLGDASFILRLRTTGRGARFLHKTDNDLMKQIKYIEQYLEKDDEWYFIVEDKEHVPIGTVGIYDIKDDGVTIGRWVMDDTATMQQSIESDLLVKDYAFLTLCSNKIYCDTMLTNIDIVRYNKMWGMTITGQSDELIFFELTKDRYLEFRKKVVRICNGGKVI